jgi:tetratricopeptide (TPR) repeat protein
MSLTEANTLAQSGQPAEAIVLYDQYLEEYPTDYAAWNNRGNALDDTGQPDKAIASFDTALVIKPDYPQALCNKGVVLHQLNRNPEALACFNRSIALDPDFAMAYTNRGNAHRHLHQYDLALADYVRATELEPALVNAHWNESTCRLLLGDYDLGWKKTRVALADRNCAESNKKHPAYDLAIGPEGGFGDAIQFTRFAVDLRKLGAKVSIAAPPPLLKLYQDSFKDFDVLPMIDNMPMPQSDYHCSIMSLPMVCGITSLDKLITPIPYLFANSALSKKWEARLAPYNKARLRVGLTWAGNPKTGADLERSLHLRDFKILVDNSDNNALFFSLQKGEAGKQIAELQLQKYQLPTLIDYTENLNDWSDTAAFIANLDLVISCDTANAHLAAAMGKPVWLLSRYNGCWRWLTDRSDSPWYPSVRLFRQPDFGDWESVMQEVTFALSEKISKTSS